MQNKVCNKCGEVKGLSEFYKNARMADGHLGHCKVCQNADCKMRRLLHLEADKIAKRAWRASHRDSCNVTKRRWDEKHPEYYKAWKQRNPERVRAIWHRYHAKKLSGGSFTSEEWTQLLKKYKNRCLFPDCNRKDVEADHVIPLALGGSNTIDNIQPLCRHHNATKHAKHIDYRMPI